MEEIRPSSDSHNWRDKVIRAPGEICEMLRQFSSEHGPLMFPTGVIQWPEHSADHG